MQLVECANYFKNRTGFNRLFLLLKDKYERLGRFSGTVVLVDLSLVEKEEISAYMQVDLTNVKDYKVSLKKFMNQLNGTKFEGIDMYDLLCAYFNHKIVINKEVRNHNALIKEKFFRDLLEVLGHGNADKWLRYVIENKSNAYSIINMRYKKDQKLLYDDLIKIGNCLNNLPVDNNSFLTLAVFAGLYTNNPHFLDIDTNNSNIFLFALAYLLELPIPISRSDKQELFFKAGIIIDEISNYVVTYGLVGNNDLGEHLGLTSFCKQKEPLVLTLTNLSNIKGLDSLNKKVFVFENPSILVSLKDYFKDDYLAIVITNGIPSSAVIMALDKLVKNGNKLYYNGDFDPEGLMIASKLKKRYLDNLELFNYDVALYKRIISSEIISDKRLIQLSSIDNIELFDVKNGLLEIRKAGYQEKMIAEIIEYIKKIVIKL